MTANESMKLKIVCVSFAILLSRLQSAEIPAANEQKPDGTIVLLATNATVHGKTIRYEPQPHKNTIGYWTKADDWVSWNFKVHAPGTFEVKLTQACGKGSGGSEVNFIIGDQIIKDLVPDTGAFTNWTNRVIGSFALSKAGDYTIEVKPVKKPGLAVMDLRAIVLSPHGISSKP
jgi:arylsulfatase A